MDSDCSSVTIGIRTSLLSFGWYKRIVVAWSKGQLYAHVSQDWLGCHGFVLFGNSCFV